MVLYKPKLRCKYFEWVDEVEADYEDNGSGIVEEENFNESFVRNNVNGLRQANMKGFRNERAHQEASENEANMNLS